MKKLAPWMSLFVCANVAACGAGAPSIELASARTAYERAANGPAPVHAPSDLHTAREALKRAEDSFAADGITPNSRDLAYAAVRRAQIAEARARTRQAVVDKDKILAEMREKQTSGVPPGH